MKRKIKKILSLIMSGNLNVLWYRLLEIIPEKLFIYDRFYFVFFHKKNFRKVRNLSNRCKLKILDFTDVEVGRIKQDLDINIAIIRFQVIGAVETPKIIRLDLDGRCIAVAFLKKVNELKSPSGYCLDLGKDFFVTWFFGLYVHPDFRLRGYHANLISCAHEFNQKNGLNGLYGEIHYLNKNSISSFMRLGFKIYKSINYLKIFKRKYFWESKGDFFV
jgi:GNAT superfamily N-acetyltransferase